MAGCTVSVLETHRPDFLRSWCGCSSDISPQLKQSWACHTDTFDKTRLDEVMFDPTRHRQYTRSRQRKQERSKGIIVAQVFPLKRSSKTTTLFPSNKLCARSWREHLCKHFFGKIWAAKLMLGISSRTCGVQTLREAESKPVARRTPNIVPPSHRVEA